MFDSKSRTECETVKPELEKRLKDKGVVVLPRYTSKELGDISSTDVTG